MNFLKVLSVLMTVLVHSRVYCNVTRAPTPCERQQFRCDDGECIAEIKLCNGEKDCNDESDETKCDSESHPKCNPGYFQCVSDRRCIDADWRCDDDDDCADASDEKHCHAYCHEYFEFQCLSNGQCIPKEMRCDGKKDCEDGSDEETCGPSRNCVVGNIPCDDGRSCFLQEWLCDGEKDCDDGSDEKQCDNAPSDSTTPAPDFWSSSNNAETTELSCPKYYCFQNEECVVIKGQYHCNCAPSFTGRMCEMRITTERNYPDLGMVIGIAMTLITLFIITALVLFFYFKRRTARNSTSLISKNESQMPFTSYSKE